MVPSRELLVDRRRSVVLPAAPISAASARHVAEEAAPVASAAVSERAAALRRELRVQQEERQTLERLVLDLEARVTTACE